MSLSADGLLLLEKVSEERSVRVDASKVLRHLTEKRREALLRFLREHAPEGVLRADYWLDAQTGVIRSRPNMMHLIPHKMFVSSDGHALVDLRMGVETICCLRDSGQDGNELADKAIVDRVRLWDYMAAELATDAEKEYVNEGMAPSGDFRNAVKTQVFGSLYGIRPSTSLGYTAEEAARQRAVQVCLLARWPGLWLGGTQDEKKAVIRKRRLQESQVWLQVACEAERLGCRVVGFCFNEPVIECPLGMSETAMTQQLTDYTYGLLKALSSSSAVSQVSNS